MSLGENIKKYRSDAGLTSEQLGKLAGLHPVTIRKYESGAMMPTIDNLKKLARALNIRCSDLDAYLEKCKIFRKRSIDTKTVISNVEELQAIFCKLQERSNHKYKANNWLKIHKKPMRRKPFKRKFVILDEYGNLKR